MARIHVDLQQRWADMDAYRHVNNVTYARYFEEARIRLFSVGDTREKTGLEGLFRDDQEAGQKMVVASQTINFLRPIEYSVGGLTVEMWISRLGGSSIELCSELVVNEPERLVAAQCVTVAVVVDGTTMKPKRLTEQARVAAKAWMGEPLDLIRHR